MRQIVLLVILSILISCNSSHKDYQATIPEEYLNTVFEPIARKLALKEALGIEDLFEFAAKPEYRQDLYYLLSHYQRLDLFPKQFYTMESAAESNMVRWLVHPNELDTVPSKIILLSKEKIKEADTVFIYYVFKFKTEPPHWAAGDGWMLGCSGPYLFNDRPYSWPKGTFSRFNSIDSSTVVGEAVWNHKHIYRSADD